jgi:2-polyprenyl-6-methoxyphenol hydroxylase-like FAD-dependent oxidoreductase
MNTGMQDAANLAWKLLARLRGGGSNALLDSYVGDPRNKIANRIVNINRKLGNIPNASGYL